MDPAALATTPCSTELGPEGILDRWRTLDSKRGLALATDARLGLEFQTALLKQARATGIPLAAIAVPSGERSPGALAEDRAERAAARALWLATAGLAERFGVAQLVLFPALASLHRSIASLRQRFALGQELGLGPLCDERASLVEPHGDRLRACLDPLLERAASCGVTVALAGPCVWPHQFPDSAELAELHREFSGAPLGRAYFADWHHMRGLVQPAAPRAKLQDELPLECAEMLARYSRRIEDFCVGMAVPPQEQDLATAAAQEPPIVQLRLADASGLRGRLVPGQGEICWQSLREDLPAPLPALLVLHGDEQTTPEELRVGTSLLAEQDFPQAE